MRLLYFICFLSVTFVSTAQIDTLSYSLGFQTTLGMLAGNNPYMEDESGFREYIRGIEENVPTEEALSDSTFLVNYCLGGMQGIFMGDSFEHMRKEELPPIDCIVAGLRMVAENKLCLPQDTIEAMSFIKGISDSVRPADLSEDERCRFYTAYGILKGIPHGLQDYIFEWFGKSTSVLATPRYYARGMADLISSSISPKSAYDIGRMVVVSIVMNTLEKTENVVMSDYIDGAKAALWLVPAKIPREVTGEWLDRFYSSQLNSEESSEAKELDDMLNLQVFPGRQYDVSWHFRASPVAKRLEVPTEAVEALDGLSQLLQGQGMEVKSVGADLLMCHVVMDGQWARSDLHNFLYALKNKWQHGRFKFFYIFSDVNDLSFGIMRTDDAFVSEVNRAELSINESGNVAGPIVLFRFGEGNASNKKDVERWANFTKRHIGSYVVFDINGTTLSAPNIQDEITAGACAITGLTVSRINRLFGQVLW